MYRNDNQKTQKQFHVFVLILHTPKSFWVVKSSPKELSLLWRSVAYEQQIGLYFQVRYKSHKLYCDIWFMNDYLEYNCEKLKVQITLALMIKNKHSFSNFRLHWCSQVICGHIAGGICAKHITSPSLHCWVHAGVRSSGFHHRRKWNCPLYWKKVANDQMPIMNRTDWCPILSNCSFENSFS